jgi:integrase
MAINLLDDKTVKAAKPTTKTTTLNDGAGMYLEITSTGSKRWRFRYKFDGITKKVSLGVYPDTTLANARAKRDDARNKVANSIDPFPPKVKVDEIKKEKTFKDWSEWYVTKVTSDVTETHIARSVKGWKKDVYPIIGDMQMNDIKAKNIISIMHIMSERDATESAKKVFSSISRVFQVALANYPDEIERNPTKDIALKDVLGTTKKTNYPIMTDSKELGSLLIAIDNYTGDISTKLALKMIAHVFVRPHNIRHADWSEIDLKTKQWIIPANKMKTRKELIVPLSKEALEILEKAKEHAGEQGLIFPSPKSRTQPLSDAAMVGALRRLGYTKDEIVAHSFRGIFSTIAHEKKVYAHEVIEAQLAHSVGSNVSRAYNRSQHLDERVEMMQWWSNYLKKVQNANS